MPDDCNSYSLFSRRSIWKPCKVKDVQLLKVFSCMQLEVCINPLVQHVSLVLCSRSKSYSYLVTEVRKAEQEKVCLACGSCTADSWSEGSMHVRFVACGSSR